VSRLVSRLHGARFELVGALILTAAALRYWLLYFNRSTNLLDEGSQAAQALRIINGELIYRDFFTVVTPASYYTVAWLFQLFGTNLMVMRWAVLVLGLGILIATLVVARHVMAWPFAAAAALMTTVWGWFLVAPNFYSWQAAFFALIALACYLRSIEHPQSSGIFWAGIATGVTVLVKQNVGAYTAAGLLLTIWLSRVFDSHHDIRQRVNHSTRFVAGLCVPIVPVVLLLIVAGAGPYLYESWVYYPLIKYPERFALPFPSLYPGLAAIAAAIAGRLPEPTAYEVWTNLVLLLPAVVYPFALAALGVLAFQFHRARHSASTRSTPHAESTSLRTGHALLAVWLVGLLTLLQAWPRADVTHILFSLQPTFILFGYLLYCGWRGLTRLPGPRPVVATAALLVTLAPAAMLLWKGYLRTHWEYQNYIVALRTDRGRGVLAHGLEAQRIDWVTRYVTEHAAPDDQIFVVPWAAGFYFLTNRSNATRTDFMLFEDPEAYPCILARLDQRRPKYVIYGYTWDVDEKHFRDYARPIDEYIRTRYEIEAKTDGYEIWRRIEGASPGSSEAWPAACRPRRFRLRDLM
jgi:hypothetical protein